MAIFNSFLYDYRRVCLHIIPPSSNETTSPCLRVAVAALAAGEDAVHHAEDHTPWRPIGPRKRKGIMGT